MSDGDNIIKHGADITEGTDMIDGGIYNPDISEAVIKSNGIQDDSAATEKILAPDELFLAALEKNAQEKIQASDALQSDNGDAGFAKSAFECDLPENNNIRKDDDIREHDYIPEGEEIEEDGQLKLMVFSHEIPNKDSDDEPEITIKKDKDYDPNKPRRVDGRFDFIELFIFTLVAVMIITTFFFRHSIVEGQSMEGTLSNGEHLIISDLFYKPKTGDIVVCADYTTSIKKPIVKRVIATEGQTVKITYDMKTGENQVYVDDVLLVEDYVYIDNPRYAYMPMEYTVEPGKIFVMGDHRNASTDSREIGTVDEDAVLGRVLIRFFPFSKFGTVK